MTVLAGAATADITPQPGLPMGGYGARVGAATGTHDPLRARAVAFSDGTTTLVVVVCDLLGVTYGMVHDARAAIEQSLGVPPENVMISATHTHSGPMWSRQYNPIATAGIIEAARQAVTDMQPVTLKVRSVGLDTIGQNRRDPAGPIDRQATVLLAAPSAPAPPVATIVNHACHATVLEHDNLEYSADYPGAACAAIETAVGGTAVFLQGAAADINPVWMRHDFADVGRVGGIVGATVARCVHELRPIDEGQWAINLSWAEEVPHPAAGGRVLEPSLAAASTSLRVPRRSFPDDDSLARDRHEVEVQLGGLAPDDLEARHRLTARLARLEVEPQYAAAFASGRLRPEEQVEVQALRLSSDCAVVSLPGEFFIGTAERLREQSPFETLLVAGYANNYVGYVPPADAWPQHGYEVGCAQFPPDSLERIESAAVDLLASIS